MLLTIIVTTFTVILMLPLTLVGCIMLTNVAINISDYFFRRVNNNENL